MTQRQTIVFFCPHGGAKSLIAACLFNRIARDRSLPYAAIAAAADDPYDSVPLPVVEFLDGEGIEVSSFKPARAHPADVRNARLVVAIDCDVTNRDIDPGAVERWDDVPRVSDDLPGSAAAIRRHVDQLAEELGSGSLRAAEGGGATPESMAASALRNDGR